MGTVVWTADSAGLLPPCLVRPRFQQRAPSWQPELQDWSPCSRRSGSVVWWPPVDWWVLSVIRWLDWQVQMGDSVTTATTHTDQNCQHCWVTIRMVMVTYYCLAYRQTKKTSRCSSALNNVCERSTVACGFPSYMTALQISSWYHYHHHHKKCVKHLIITIIKYL